MSWDIGNAKGIVDLNDASENLSDYFNTDDLGFPLGEQQYEYRVCDFCASPPCSDCLPWDMSLFKASEVPVYFPMATLSEDGSLQVNRHVNCRCQLFPIGVVTGAIDLTGNELSDDIRLRLEAMRNHFIAFSSRPTLGAAPLSNRLDAVEGRLKDQEEKLAQGSIGRAKSPPLSEAEIMRRQVDPDWLLHDMEKMEKAQGVTDGKINSIFEAPSRTDLLTATMKNSGTGFNTGSLYGPLYSLSYGARNPAGMLPMAARYGLRFPMRASQGAGALLGDISGGALAGEGLMLPEMGAAVLTGALTQAIIKQVQQWVEDFVERRIAYEQMLFNKQQAAGFRDAYRGIIPG